MGEWCVAGCRCARVLGGVTAVIVGGGGCGCVHSASWGTFEVCRCACDATVGMADDGWATEARATRPGQPGGSAGRRMRLEHAGGDETLVVLHVRMHRRQKRDDGERRGGRWKGSADTLARICVCVRARAALTGRGLFRYRR